MPCDVCGLPDPYNGTGDGIGSCDCPRCDCGSASGSDFCTCPLTVDDQYDYEPDDPGPDPYGEPMITTVNLPEDR